MLAATEACKSGAVASLQLLLDHPPAPQPQNRDPLDRQLPQLLKTACSSGHVAGIKLLLRRFRGVKLDLLDAAAQEAVRNGHWAVLELMVQEGGALRPRSNTYDAALISAASCGHAAVIRVLLTADRLAQAKQSRCSASFLPPPAAQQAAIAAASLGHIAALLTLLDAGLDVNADCSQLGEVAAVEGRAEVLEVLVRRGLNMEQVRSACQDVLQVLAGHGRVDAIKLLVERVKVDPWQGGHAALQAAAASGQKPVLQYLLPLLKQQVSTSSSGPTLKAQLAGPLAAAAAAGKIEAMSALLEAGADPASDDGAALVKAVQGGRVEVAKLLLEHSVPADCKGGEPLRGAAWSGNTALLALLLQHGAGIPAHMGAALQLATNNGKAEVVQVLLDHWAGMGQGQGKDGQPLMLAREVLVLYHDLAIAWGAALVTAASAGHASIVESLLRLCFGGGSPLLLQQQLRTQLDDAGPSALLHAAKAGQGEVVATLLEWGVLSEEDVAGAPGAAALQVGNPGCKVVACVVVG